MKAKRENYKIKVTETKDRKWKKKAFDSTVRFDSNVSDLNSYIMEHSPIYQEEYLVEMINIPVFVSTHFLRSGPGTYDYILTQRDDRGGSDEDGRWEQTNHSLFINAAALITLASKRMCYKSHKETRYVMDIIRLEINKINNELAMCLVPMCVRRNGLCKELKNTCGMKEQVMEKYSYYKDLFA